MIGVLRRRFVASSVFNYNMVLRDRWVAQQAARVPAGARVLDCGAGSCPYRPLFAHCEYRSQDAMPITNAADHRSGSYGTIDYVCDVTAIPVPDGSFDCILCTEMLEHHPRPIDVVREFGRVLAPGGRLILTAPLGSGLHQEPHHYYGGYTPFWYERFLGEAGFVDLRIEPNGGSLRFFGQEAVRFLRLSNPLAAPLSPAQRVLWAPIWLALLPVLGVLAPIAGALLENARTDVRHTVGYHVLAVRAGTAASAGAT